MKSYIFFLAFSIFAFKFTLGEKCQSFFSQTNLTSNEWQGHLKFKIPKATTKWKVVVTFDKPVESLSPWDGVNGKCTKGKKKCVFTNGRWNSQNPAGYLKLGFEIRFDNTYIPPTFDRIVFRYCTSNSCKKYDKKYVVQCGDGSISAFDSNSDTGETSELSVVNSQTADNGKSCVLLLVDNQL